MPRNSLKWLVEAPDKANLAEDLSSEELSKLASDVTQSFEIDKVNRKDWDAQMGRALKLAKQVVEKKSTPWEGAASVKHPLITVATIQFAARAYPEICKSGSVVKCQVTGDDPPEPPQPDQSLTPLPGQEQLGISQGPVPPISQPPGQMPPQLPAGAPPAVGGLPQEPQGPQGPQLPMPMLEQLQQPQPKPQPVGPKTARANRVSSHMNWQLTQEQQDWEADMDCLLHVLPVVGQCYKKSYFSAQDKHNISELVLPDDCFVSKGRSRDIKKARRITHRLWIYENEAVEKMRRKLWLDCDLDQAPSADGDTDAPHEFLEQHCYHDLDGDGYKEPYIVTVHKESSKVVRVAARWVAENVEVEGKKVVSIKPDHYFTHYGFIPNPDGSINFLGFGQLLEPINASINTVLNQLLDAGHLANAGGGFVGRGVRMRGGTWSFRPGEWKMVDVQGGLLKENLIPLPIKEPSATLFQLLGFLVTMGKEISSVHDIITGAGDVQMASNMPVGTAMALVEQGLKVFTAIYKRIFRSLAEEFKKLYTLNARFLDPRVTFQVSGHPEQFVDRSDYIAGDTMVMPVADPELSSDMQRILKSQALKEISGRPGLNEIEVTRRLVRAVRPENVEDVLMTDNQLSGKEAPPWQSPPPPQAVLAEAKAVRMKQQAEEAMARLQMDMAKFQLELMKIQTDIANVKADTMLKLAKAEEVDQQFYLETYKQQMNQIDAEISHKINLVKMAVDKAAAGANQPVDPAQQLGLEPPEGQGEMASPEGLPPEMLQGPEGMMPEEMPPMMPGPPAEAGYPM